MMSKKVKVALAIGLQLAMIGAIGDFVKWPYMKYVFIASGVAFVMTFGFFIYDAIKE
jgi:hypothetical protein